MRDILNKIDNILTEATLSANQITRYPERFEAFISHIRDERPFFTENGEEVVLLPTEAGRFLDLHNKGLFKGALKGKDIDGKEWPLSSFRKTAEFGGASAKPGEEESNAESKEGVMVKPSQIHIVGKDIPAHSLLKEITSNQTLAATEYGRAVIQAANNIALKEPAVISKDLIKNEKIKKAIVDYAGEYLGVLALIFDQIDFPKRDEFLEWLDSDISGLVIHFPVEISNPLADSFASITNPSNQKQLNISSKGTGGGAAPSLSGIVVPDHLRKKKAYQTAIDIIDICQNSSLPKPLSVSQVFQVMNLLNERIPDSIPKEFKPFLPWSADIVAEVQNSMKNKVKMPKYRSLFADLVSKGEDGGKLTYVVKKAVLEIVNSGAVPEFESAVLEILDYNFIQLYTSISGRSGELTFFAQWPAKLDGEISMETKSGGTDPTKGGFSFKLKPKGSSKTEINPYIGEPDTSIEKVNKETKKKVSGITNSRVDVRPKGAKSEKTELSPTRTRRR